MQQPFLTSALPPLYAGPGSLSQLPKLVVALGTRIMVIHGASSEKNGVLSKLLLALRNVGIHVQCGIISGEPTVARLDELAEEAKNCRIQVIIGLGGGSVLDSAKALATLVPVTGSVQDFLEGVGTKQHPGDCLPWIAIPTTAGTGSEASSNAVLKGMSSTGVGYKRSLRHPHFLPSAIILAPELALGTPRNITLACAMDAFSQLLESYTSTLANPLTDAITMSGLEHISRAILELERGDSDGLQLRFDLGFGALCSGFGLANAGLGLVHGFAGLIGAERDIAHGVVCGTLIAPCFRATLDWLVSHPSASSSLGIQKLANVGALYGRSTSEKSAEARAFDFMDRLDSLVSCFEIPRLKPYGFTDDELVKIATQASNRNSPAQVDQETRLSILRNRW